MYIYIYIYIYVCIYIYIYMVIYGYAKKGRLHGDPESQERQGLILCHAAPHQIQTCPNKHPFATSVRSLGGRCTSYIYIYIYRERERDTYVCTYIYIYICIEREREIDQSISLSLYIYIYNNIYIYSYSSSLNFAVMRRLRILATLCHVQGSLVCSFTKDPMCIYIYIYAQLYRYL